MSRAVINYLNDKELKYANIEATHFSQNTTHLIVCKGDNIVGVFTWENVVSAYISERTEK